MLTVRNLSFCYGSRAVLSGISLESRPESITALLGPNGSGKTTLLRCLDLFLQPTSGEILLDGLPLDSFSSNALAQKVAYMPQRCGITGLTVFDSLLLGRKPYLSQRPESEDFELVEKTLKRLNLTDKSLQTLDRLSGGELQKAALGRIFVQDPELILLDEPTSALDLKNRVEILRHLVHFVHRKKAAVIMSLHDLNDALAIADRLLFLKKGKIVADETPDTITGETLSEIYDISLELYTIADKKLVVSKECPKS